MKPEAPSRLRHSPTGQKKARKTLPRGHSSSSDPSMAGRAPEAGGAATSSSCSAALAGDLREVLRRVQSVGYCLDLDSRDTTQLDAVFQRIFDVFLSDIAQQCAVPTPAMLGDGRPVDLFRLYSLVRGRGGHDAVTAGKLWPKVATRAGFEASAASAVKLVYSKYLEPLDRWFDVVLAKKEVSEDAVAETTPAQVGNEVEAVVTPRGSKPGRLWTPSKGKQTNPAMENGGELPGDDGEAMVLDMVKVEEASPRTPSKRERDALPEMLSWVREAAKNPGRVGLGAKGSTGEADKKLEMVEQFSLALTIRKELTVKRVIRTTFFDSSLPLEKQRGHPSFYEDYAGRQSDDKLRSSQRILSKLSAEEEDEPPSKRLRSCSARQSSEDSPEELNSVDPTPHVRAEVHPWTDNVVPYSSDDLRWLGTKIWPREENDKRKAVELTPIGKGRQDGCACERHGSVECVRFHVAEKRLQLKLELQNSFYKWKFDRMGEEVALSWTEEEEEKFKTVVRLNSPLENGGFWNKLYQSFPSKSRQTLVSYYFNVFLIRRRCYQNRVTPSHVDSDDEEAEFGFLGSTYGKDAVTVRGSKRIICTENTQCIDLDEL